MSTKVIQVIEADEQRGEGTTENPFRVVRVYYSLDGNVLATSDSWLDMKNSGQQTETTPGIPHP